MTVQGPQSDGTPSDSSTTTEPSQARQLAPIGYRSAVEEGYRRGADIPTRILGGIAFIIFGLMGFGLWCLAIQRGSWTAPDRRVLPVMSVALAGSIFCLLVALGIIGKRKNK